MPKINMYESVLHNQRVPVHDYEELGLHHITNYLNHTENRPHAQVDGEFEEVVYINHKTFVSKDMVLYDSSLAGSPNQVSDQAKRIGTPSPIEGVIGRVDETHGLVDINDPVTGEHIVRIRHMRDIKVHEGERVSYGEPLGTQSNKATVPVHTHMDFNINHLDKFKQYIKDIDSGVITTDFYPAKANEYNTPNIDQGSPGLPHSARINTQKSSDDIFDSIMSAHLSGDDKALKQAQVTALNSDLAQNTFNEVREQNIVTENQTVELQKQAELDRQNTVAMEATVKAMRM